MSVAFNTLSKPAAAPSASASAIVAIGTASSFNRNNTIFSEGDDARFAYKVISGGVRLCKMMADGRRQIAEFALPGDYFGFDWLEQHALTAEALVDTTVACYSRSRLDRLGEEDSQVRAELFSTLRHDLWAAQNHLVILGRQSARERVASFLLQLMARRRNAERRTVSVPMTRQDIADYLGLTIETVCRVLTSLKRDGIIDIPNRQEITVRNENALRNAAQPEDLD
ncbi:MAG TPA: helix-turn-helix domain-containing protein [Rhizomicrobium sp.]|nr:helix-turn-helix domain-containing protein [Rhizomicrobium sp.]